MTDTTPPTLGSVWELIEAPGSKWSVISVEKIETLPGLHVMISQLEIETFAGIEFSRVTIAFDIAEFFEKFRVPQEEKRLTSWERLLLDDFD